LKAKVFTLISVATLLFLGGCARHYQGEFGPTEYGFFSGVWHGFISPFSIIINFISWLLAFVGVSFLNDVQIIGRPNTGLSYYVGFFLGFALLSSGSDTAKKSE